MAGAPDILAPGFRIGRRQTGSVPKRRRRLLLAAVVASVAVHLTAAVLLVSLPRILPKEAPPPEQGTVELLMVEKKGAEATSPVQGSDAAQPPKPAEQPDIPKPAKVAETPKPPKPADVPKPAKPADVPKPPEQPDTPKPAKAADVPKPPEQADAPKAAVPGTETANLEARDAEVRAGQPAPPPQEAPLSPPVPTEEPAASPPAPETAEERTSPADKEAAVQPVAPQPQKAPVFDLDGTDSESNAIAMGGQIVPALRDDRFRNRPPIYPVEAEVRGEHGSVVVTIHVAENGLAAGADVTESSGFSVLDQAALTAVRKWHFHPAIKEGRSVPFDMPFRFIFEPY
jgi:protein TonB